MNSTRLPSKVLLPLVGKPMLERQIERINYSELINELIVATSLSGEDQQIEDLCESIGVKCFRGELDDVLDRFYEASKMSNADLIMRLTGDCPLIDPFLLDEIISYFKRGDFDYVCNSLEPTYPDGLDAELFTSRVLTIAWNEARSNSEREHVTSFIRKSQGRFKMGCLKNDEDFSDCRWTVDEPEDYELMKFIYNNLYKEGQVFTWKDVLLLREKYPEQFMVNAKIAKNEGYNKSIQEDDC